MKPGPDSVGKLFGFDQDADARANATAINDPWLTFVASNFRNLKRYLRLYKVEQVDGILADLGISSHQIDTPDRGFSTRFEADLDMRMNQQADRTARRCATTYETDVFTQRASLHADVTPSVTVFPDWHDAQTGRL